MNNLFCLIKFGRKENLERLIEKGEMRFGAIVDFQTSTEKERGDKFEGAINIINEQFSKIECDHPDLGKFSFRPINNSLGTIINFTNDLFYSFSSYALTSDSFKEVDIHIIDERMAEFGDYALVINEPFLFLNQVRQKLTEMKKKWGCQLVDYKDYKKRGTIETDIFSKTFDLKHQFEHRILIYSEQNEKEIFIEIGSIDKLCFLIKTEEILNTEFKSYKQLVYANQKNNTLTHHIRQFIMKKLIFLSLLISFLSCKNTDDKPLEDNVNKTLDEVELQEAIKKVDSIEVLSKEMDEVQEPEIPERSSYRFAKVWQDGVENEPERGTASLFFSNEKQNLILNLAGNVINLKCVEKFNKNPDGYSYATYETTNGLIMTLGYIGTNGIEWYLKYKNLNGIIMEVELSNDKNAWD